ncbi:MAG: glycosyltransferase family 4 protein [bacterium]|nr:glycosyltransferase family 4 protein [bacterium]
MKINVLLNIGKKPSGASRPIIEYCNALSKSNDILIYKAFNPNKKGFEFLLREAAGLFMKGKTFSPGWIECRCPIIIIPSYRERFIREADIIFFRSVHLAREVSKWKNSKGTKVMRVSNTHILKNSTNIPDNVVLIASSTMVYERLKILYPGHKIFRVNNGVNCTLFSYEEKKHNQPQSIGMVFYGGKNAKHKGMETGFEVMKRIKWKFPWMKFFIVGLKKEKIIPDFVEFLNGYKSRDILKFYRMTDILIYPSFEDAWPNPPMEAMACGCAVVSTDVGGIRDFAVDRETIMICTPGNVDEMTYAVQFLIQNPLYWKKLTISGATKIRQFDYSIQSKVMEKVFHEILSTG